MISPLAMATRGRLSTSVKRTLTLATLGWLIAVIDPQPKPDERPRGGGSGIVTPKHEEEKNLTLINIKRDDDEILTLLNIFLQCRK